MFFIEDGTGQGNKAKVDSDNMLAVASVSDSIQHYISAKNGQAYQIIGTSVLNSGTVVVLHVTNNDPTLHMVLTYIRHQIIGASGGGEFPNVDNYFKIAFGRTYASGGSSTVATNMNQVSGNIAGVVAYDSNPTLSGTALEIDRWYTKANGDMNAFDKEESIIIHPNLTVELSYVGDQTSGTIYSRLSFLMREAI